MGNFPAEHYQSDESQLPRHSKQHDDLLDYQSSQDLCLIGLNLPYEDFEHTDLFGLVSLDRQDRDEFIEIKRLQAVEISDLKARYNGEIFREFEHKIAQGEASKDNISYVNFHFASRLWFRGTGYTKFLEKYRDKIHGLEFSVGIGLKSQPRSRILAPAEHRKDLIDFLAQKLQDDIEAVRKDWNCSDLLVLSFGNQLRAKLSNQQSL